MISTRLPHDGRTGRNERQRLKKELGKEYVSSDSDNDGKSRDSRNQISVDNFNEDLISPLSSVVSPKASDEFRENKAQTNKIKVTSKAAEAKRQKVSQVTAKEDDLNKRFETTYFPLRKLADYLEKNSKNSSGKNG